MNHTFLQTARSCVPAAARTTATIALRLLSITSVAVALLSTTNDVAAAQGSMAKNTTPAAVTPKESVSHEYTILLYESDQQLASRTSGTLGDTYWTAYDDFAAELAKAGVLRGGSALDEDVRVTVRGNGSADAGVRGARLGGYFVIAAADRATAEAWARKAPRGVVTVEVRPHRPNPHAMGIVAK